jgi:type IV pilus assembly protein PilM
LISFLFNLKNESHMLSSLLSGKPKMPSHVVSIDLGQRTTKAVSVQRKGAGYELLQYTLADALPAEKSHDPEAVSNHLRSVSEALGLRNKPLVLVIGVGDSILRQIEVPFLPLPDLRLMLKYNSKTYLQQDLPEHVFDACILGMATNGKQAPDAGKQPSKARAIVGGAKKQLLDNLQSAAKQAGLVAGQVVPSLVCPANAFEISHPDAFKEVVALVDIGFKSSTISLLANGELALTRVVALGSDRLTTGLAEAMNVSYQEAENIKVGLSEEVLGMMQTLILPLGRELRASIDFFEHQQDKQVTQVFVSGGTARSQFLVDTLQAELMLPTKAWNPANSFTLSLPPEKIGEIEEVGTQLTVALGGAIAAL